MADPHHIASVADLDALAAANKYLILDFWAEWCPPCKAIAPLFAKLSAELALPGAVAFGKVDVDEAPDVAAKFGVTAMPTFIVLTDGEAKGVRVGAGAAVAGGGVVTGDEGEVRLIRGADPRNLVALAHEVVRLAKEEGVGAAAAE
ncbi:28bcdd26-8b01-4090-95c3-eb31894a5df7 [Thermothielavioides terrestris]|uniref:28bcdd26-8b01-4090-95c3-eb31894a5df7 n=1 Tax=Thermothielavioides terrestris TaxID=2587410 RepID=A0A3S4F3J6_9PEZI|nr:28bcdd26-8b01-4090-95c3-eb31894a5df7 [Thermothielavioides terrestris]